MVQTTQDKARWDDFFASPDRVPQDFIPDRDDQPAQERNFFYQNFSTTADNPL